MRIRLILTTVAVIVFFSACDEAPFFKKRKKVSKENYEEFKGEVLSHPSSTTSDSSSVFDKPGYDPNSDSMEGVLQTLQEGMMVDSAAIKTLGIDDSGIFNQEMHADSAIVTADTFTQDIKKITPAEIKALKYNLESFKLTDTVGRSAASCAKGTCKIWVRVSKKAQQLYLHLDGVLVDSFKVSTGTKGHETPNFDTKPNGLMFQKYTSKKYPGGNYNGLGNMPYVVFIKGGYAIHGTTVGNFKKLGSRASHGCIRLHPDHAKLLFELVKAAGSNYTWISVGD